MSTNKALREVARGNNDKPEKSNTFPAMLETYKVQIARALPRHLNPDQMLRVALTAFRMTPKLAECQPASVFAAVVQASQLGLRPNMLGECYLIPYKGQCQLQIGYQGMLELVRRSGLVESIGAYLVRDTDQYEVRFGTDPGIVHVPNLDAPGKVILGYAVAKLKGGGTHVEVMTRAEIDAIRDRSQNVQNAKRYGKKTPWDTDFDEMARKTLVRRVCKYLPKSNELATAISLNDAADHGAQAIDIKDAIDGTFVAPPMQAIDMDSDATTGDPEAPDYAAQIAAAKTLDDLDLISDSLEDVEAGDDLDRLRGLINERRAAIGGE